MGPAIDSRIVKTLDVEIPLFQTKSIVNSIDNSTQIQLSNLMLMPLKNCYIVSSQLGLLTVCQSSQIWVVNPSFIKVSNNAQFCLLLKMEEFVCGIYIFLSNLINICK